VFRSEQKNDAAHLRIEVVVQTPPWASLANLNVRQRPRLSAAARR